MTDREARKKAIVESSGSEVGSENAALLERDIDAAQKALDAANCEELFALFQRAVKERGDAMKMMLQVAGHYIGTKDSPLFEPSSDAINSMERVSLAAIQLARDLVAKETK